MIAVSDAVLILVSAAALGAGLHRWQNNIEANTQPQVSAQSSGSVNLQPRDTNTLAAPAVVVDDAQTEQVTAIDNVEAASIVAQPAVDQPAVEQTDIQQSPNVVPLGAYVVQAGDSLSKIALDFGTTVEQLQRINTIEGSLIDIGQELYYPLPAN